MGPGAYSVGQEVEARTKAGWENATILAHNDNDRTYAVKFFKGTTGNWKLKSLRPLDEFKLVARRSGESTDNFHKSLAKTWKVDREADTIKCAETDFEANIKNSFRNVKFEANKDEVFVKFNGKLGSNPNHCFSVKETEAKEQ